MLRLALAAFPLLLAGRLCPPLYAADAGSSPEYDEKLRHLNGLVQDLLDSQAVIQKRLSSLTDDLHGFRDDTGKLGDRLSERFVTRQEFQQLAAAVKELDHKREDDKRLILDEIKKLAQTPVVVPPRDLPKPPPKDTTPEGPVKGYKYTVKKDETLWAIIKAYRDSGVKVSQEDIQKANPTLKPNLIREGQVILIPDPALK